MKVFYKKNDNSELLKKMEEFLDFKNIQNYIPLYKNFFNLNENNYNSINLNNFNNLINLEEKINYSKFLAKIKNEENNIFEKKIFIKYSPLLDPCKYVYGKYDNSYNILLLPNFINNNDITCNEKINNIFNTCYCDSFFSFLSSKLLNEYNFLNGIDFYGSFIGLKNNFRFDISEDLEYLNDSEYFKNNLNINFSFLN